MCWTVKIKFSFLLNLHSSRDVLKSKRIHNAVLYNEQCSEEEIKQDEWMQISGGGPTSGSVLSNNLSEEVTLKYISDEVQQNSI